MMEAGKMLMYFTEIALAGFLGCLLMWRLEKKWMENESKP